MKKPIYRGNGLKKGGLAWIVCRFKGGSGVGKKKRAMQFMLDSNH